MLRSHIHSGSVLHRATALALSIAAVFLLFAAPALAAKPKTGNWGLWGGDSGPVGGAFQVAGKHHKYHLTLFGDAQTCLMSATGADNFWINHSIPVSKSGSFSFTGTATADGTTAVPVMLNGQFTSATTAKVSFTVSYGTCAATTLTIHHTAG